MKTLNNPSKVYIKSTNSYDKMMSNYNISLIIFTIITIVINIIIDNKNLSLSLIKNLIIILTITSIITYIINIIKKEYNILKLYTSDTIISISIILAFFSINTNTYVIVLATLLTILIKNIYKKINISSSLYGILLIILYKYFNNEITTIINNSKAYKDLIDGNILNYLFGITNLNPVLSLISFIYLFHHKCIKYNIVFSYIITFLVIIFLYGIFNQLSIWYGIVTILTNNILFLTSYTLSDYRITPTISEGNTVYGIILGIISAILTIIIPEIAIIVPLIIGPLLLTKAIDNISPKLKYNNELYIGVILTLVAIIILTIFSLILIF